MAIHMGYMGHAKLDGNLVKITGSSINPVQNVEAPELMAGDWNKKAWVMGKIETGGGIQGPLTQSTEAQNIWDYAWQRDLATGDKMRNAEIQVDIAYYKGNGRTFNDCQINSYELSVTAGEFANFNIDFMGTTTAAYVGDPAQSEIACEKMVTWDVCEFAITGFDVDEMQQYSITVGNNLQRIYKLNQAATIGLYPAEILAGIRTIEGSLSFYADDKPDLQFPPGTAPLFGADAYADYEASDTTAVTVTAGSPAVVSVGGKMVFGRAQAAGQTGPAIYTVSFTGVCEQTED